MIGNKMVSDISQARQIAECFLQFVEEKTNSLQQIKMMDNLNGPQIVYLHYLAIPYDHMELSDLSLFTPMEIVL